MKRLRFGLLDRSLFTLSLLTLALAVAIATRPALAAQQAPSQGPINPSATPPPPPDQTPAPAPAPESSPAPGAQPQQPSTQPQPPAAQPQAQPTTATPNDQPLPQQDHPKVKPGSEEDVNAIGNRGVGKGLDFYSIEREMALGKQLAQEVERSSKLVDDPVVTEYVNRVGQNLVRNSDAKVPFTIKVIDSDVVNAFALPGGFFYVNSGLILRADSEAEMAGVMAHEIAHVAARHGTKDASKAQIAQLATIPLILLGPGGWAGYGLYQGLNLAIPLSFLQFSRDHEYEADHLGLQYMYKAGYDPNAFVTFFEKIEAEEKRQPGTIPKMFSTHPPTPDRVIAIQREIETELPARDQYIVTTSEFDAVQGRLRRIENHNKVQDTKSNRPTLRTRTQNPQPTAGGQQPNDTSADPSDDPDRPTLKKRPDDSSDPDSNSN